MTRDIYSASWNGDERAERTAPDFTYKWAKIDNRCFLYVEDLLYDHHSSVLAIRFLPVNRRAHRQSIKRVLGGRRPPPTIRDCWLFQNSFDGESSDNQDLSLSIHFHWVTVATYIVHILSNPISTYTHRNRNKFNPLVIIPEKKNPEMYRNYTP